MFARLLAALTLPTMVVASLFAAPSRAFAQDPCKQDDPPPPPECWAVDVTPDGDVTPTRTTNTSGHTATFTVTNLGNPDTYLIDCTGSANVTCTNVSPSAVSSSAVVTVTYSVGAPGSGTLTICASGMFASDCGWYSVPVHSFDVSVTPDGGPAGTTPTRVPNTGGYTADFTVQNTGTGTDTWSLACTGSANVTCGTMSARSVNLAGSASQPVTVSYSVGAAGTGTLTLTATSAQSNNSGFFTVPVIQPPGPPIVDVTPYNFDKQDYGSCAFACFATVYAQSTVPYFSLNTPRSVTLVYNSDRVNPRPFVHVDVTPDLSNGTPTEYQLQAKINGALVTFVTGGKLLRFKYPGNVKVRLGGQFDAAANNAGATGVYALDILVTAQYGSGPATTSIPTKLVVVSENASPIAAGWTLGGVQRLYAQPDGSALITEGDGSAVYFRNIGGTFEAPRGEFSTLSGVGGWTRRYPDGAQALFDASGRLTQLVDRVSNVTTIAYDSTGRVWKITDPANLVTTLSYGTNGLTSIQDAGSPARTTAVTVDAGRNLTAISDPDGVTTRLVFDGTFLLSKIISRRGDTTEFRYHTGSRKDTLTISPRIAIHGEAQPVTANVTQRPWQHVGVPYTAADTMPPLADTVRGRVIDPRGFSTSFTVNRWGSPVQLTDAVNGVTTITYSASGLPVRVGYPTGGIDTMAYNASGLPVFVQSAGVSAINIRYGIFGQPDSIWSTGRPTVRHYLGLFGRVDSTMVAGESKTRYTYDTHSRVSSLKDPEGHLLVKHTYAGTNGNLSRDSLPGNRITTYLQDSFGRDTAVQAPDSPLRRTHYDIVNRPTEVFDGVNASPTTAAYDSLFIRSVTDPKGQVYGFTYNALGWLTQRIDPQSRADQYAYDRSGNLKRWINRRGDSLVYVYDGLDRLTSKTGSNTTSESWSYSADRRVVTSTSPVSTETDYFGVSGVADSVKTILAGQTYWRRYLYSIAALLDSVDFAGSAVSLRARKYLYDPSFRALTQIRISGAATVIARNKDLQDTSVTFPGGDRVKKLFYPLHNATQISTSAPYNNTIARSISYEGLGRIKQQMEGDGSIGRKFTYDSLSRLRSDSTLELVPGQSPPPSCDGNPPPIVDEFGNSCVAGEATWQVTSGVQFSYDQAGNRTDNGGAYVTGNRISAFAGCSYSTDFDGNVTARTCGTETIAFGWTAESRLATVTVSGQTIAFQYDAAGRLVRKDVNGVAQSHFLWGGANLLAELNGAGTGVVSEYSYYPGLDKLHAIVVGGQQYNAHADGLGNTIALTGADQGVKRTYAYDPWGQLTGGSDIAGFAGTDRARFKGALSLGPEADFYYMRARWYEPKSGRFLSEDPIGLAGGINGYAFGADDPINLGDPTGEELVVIGGVAFECNTLDLGTGSTVTRCDAVEVGGVTVEGDPSGPPGFPEGPSMGGNPGAVGEGSGGGGPPTGSGPRPLQAGPTQSCWGEAGLLLANAVVDGASIFGIVTGAGVLIRGAAKLATGALVNVTARSVGTIGLEVAGRQGYLRGLAATGSTLARLGGQEVGAGALEATIAYTPDATAAMAGGADTGFSLWDLVPGTGTWKAFKAWRNCHARK